ncbi:molecular chaperone DnaK [Leptolyngbyaceae cyanobacterium CCMR0082]|uniref:Molecular chaperone DnaK n=1 Tax=Adonisia turfae CCMR0082 TaxID=2304604 RepID=A0A6M0SIC6_9CYAN|nr:molecular chaperone DnaK [Adonisia turfae CCMR0082]
MSKVVGIDLGTTNSCIAVMEGGKPTIIPNSEGFRITPSVVAYDKNGARLVGQLAQHQAVMHPEDTFYSFKRFIGCRYDEVAEDAKEATYKVLNVGSRVKLDCPQVKRQFSPEEIAARVLQKLVNDASKYIGEPITQAVITVPAYFNDAQRLAIKDSGKIAGLEILRIINEPTAASLTYGLDKKSDETIVMFDLGGGNLSISIVKVGNGAFEVWATSGSTHLGGDDFDKRIVDYLAVEFQKIEGINLREDKQVLQRLTKAAEEAKIELSSVTQAEIHLPCIVATKDGPKHLKVNLTRAKFEELCTDLLDRCRILIYQVLKDSKLREIDIDEIVLMGGSTRIPAIKNLMKRTFRKEPNETINPDEAVAIGAAIQGGVLAGEVKDILLLDVTPLNLGIETLGGVMTTMIPRNTTIPTKKSEVFSTAVDGQTSVEIHILQGNHEMSHDNLNLGVLRLDGIPPASRGVSQIEVMFDIDANGLLNVTAKDKCSGKKETMSISGTSTIQNIELDKQHQCVSLSNQIEPPTHWTPKHMSDFNANVVYQPVKTTLPNVSLNGQQYQSLEQQMNELKAQMKELKMQYQRIQILLEKIELEQTDVRRP